MTTGKKGQMERIQRLRANERRSSRSIVRGPEAAHPVHADFDWAMGVCEAADKLVNGSGRQKPDAAYRTLVRAVNGVDEEAGA